MAAPPIVGDAALNGLLPNVNGNPLQRVTRSSKRLKVVETMCIAGKATHDEVAEHIVFHAQMINAALPGTRTA